MQHIARKPTNDREAQRRKRSQRARSFLLNFVTFGLAIVVIVASFRVSAPEPADAEDTSVTHERMTDLGGDLS